MGSQLQTATIDVLHVQKENTDVHNQPMDMLN